MCVDAAGAVARAAWPGKVLSLTFPGNLFTAPDSEVQRYTRQYLAEGSQESKLIIGCAKEFPRHEFDRVFSAIAAAMG